jgi:hypothetical protein
MNLKTKEISRMSTFEKITAFVVGVGIGIALLLLGVIAFGWVLALVWNGFLVPVFSATTISWWQGSIAVLGIWTVIRVIELSKGK